MLTPCKRARLRLTQEQFAARHGILLPTLREGEEGRAVPDRAVGSCFVAIEAAYISTTGAGKALRTQTPAHRSQPPRFAIAAPLTPNCRRLH
jgi:hypothetical protein